VSKVLRIFVPSSSALLTDHLPHGEGLIAWSILSGLAERGHELVVCARRVALRSRPSFEVVETGYASARESLEPLMYARLVGRIHRTRARSARFDVAHWLFPQGRHELLFAPTDGTPFVIGPHSPEWPAGARTPLPGDLVRLAARPLFSREHRRSLDAAGVIFVSVPDAASVFPERYRAKTHVLPFGVDARRFAPTPLPSDRTVLFVGRLDETKGVRDVVESFAQARMVLGDARLVLVGEGPDAAWVESARDRLGLNGSLELRGRVPHDRVAEQLQEATLVCLPSRGEPFGMALVEAMAAGRPVLAADSGGPRYILGRSALAARQLVPEGDADRLSDALVELLGDRFGLDALAAENRRLVEEELDLERTLDVLESTYRELAS
jgi:glycosyltransferase involved in cell wall biosynthesis